MAWLSRCFGQALSGFACTPAAARDTIAAASIIGLRCFSSSPATGQQQREDMPPAAGPYSSSEKGGGSSSGGSDGSGGTAAAAAADRKSKVDMSVGKLNQEELWFAAVAGKCQYWAKGKHPALKGQHEAVANEVKERYYDLLEKYAGGRVMDDLSRRQFKAACLAAASYPVVLERTGSSEAAEELIQQGMGGAVSSMFSQANSFTTWIKTTLLGRSPQELALQALQDVAADMSHSCDCEVQVEGDRRSARLKVTACMYKDVLGQEGLPQLLKYQCCQANMMWLQVYKGYGVECSLNSSMARGDDCCTISISSVAEK